MRKLSCSFVGTIYFYFDNICYGAKSQKISPFLVYALYLDNDVRVDPKIEIPHCIIYIQKDHSEVEEVYFIS